MRVGVTPSMNESVKSALGILLMFAAVIGTQFTRNILPSIVTSGLMVLVFLGLFVFAFYGLSHKPESKL